MKSAPYWNIFLGVLALELALLLYCVEFLVQCMPAQLQKLSHANCFRVDGRRSSRRTARERRAMWKVRSDLAAVFLLFALVGHGLLYFVHSQLMPLPLVAQAVVSFQPSPQAWRDELRRKGIDEEHANWYRSTARASNGQIRAQQSALWGAWPLALVLGLLWLLGGAMLIRWAHHKILREFQTAARSRAAEYQRRDLGRRNSGRWPERVVESA
ncbi:MAG: hypothetical protein KDA45_15970 [Planctomycetales bacterium]|nr:hypothetical protein [Planctomycetales bacterium]